MTQERIDPARLVPMDIFEKDFPVRINLAYAGTDNFANEPVYRPDARLWLQEDMAAVVLLAARLCHARHGYEFVLYDGLRTVTAQEAMQDTYIVRENPHWLAPESRMLSLPGSGGHPRGLAIDAGLVTDQGKAVPMGTVFDELSVAGNGPAVNRAHRDYEDLPPLAKDNRRILEDCMMQAAGLLGVSLLPLPTEWWDFRVPSEIGDRWAPLRDEDLPPQMRMTGRCLDAPGPADFPDTHFAELKTRIAEKISPFCKPGDNAVPGTSESRNQSSRQNPPAP